MLWLYLITVSSLLCPGGLASNSDKSPTKYILYDINPGEGFNLRRDVYMRMAVFVRYFYKCLSHEKKIEICSES